MCLTAVSLFIFSFDMKFLKIAAILLVVIAALDFAIGKLLHHYYFTEKYGKDAEMTYVFTKVNSDVIITGSSRARRNYNPNIIGDSLNMSCYNAGHDGQSLFYDLALLKVLNQRYHPKLVVVDLLPEEIYYNPIHYDRLSVLLPYYHDFFEIRNTVNLRGLDKIDTSATWYKVLPLNKEKVKLLSSIYPYNSTLYDIIMGHYKKEKYALSGFYPLQETLTPDKAKDILRQYKELYSKPSAKLIDPNKVNYLKALIEMCQRNNIKVVIALSPAIEYIDREEAYETIGTIAAEHNIPFMDYTLHKELLNLNYFADNHMNFNGANQFSSELGHELKSYMDTTK